MSPAEVWMMWAIARIRDGASAVGGAAHLAEGRVPEHLVERIRDVSEEVELLAAEVAAFEASVALGSQQRPGGGKVES